jgi:hypothetical protein
MEDASDAGSGGVPSRRARVALRCVRPCVFDFFFLVPPFPGGEDGGEVRRERGEEEEEASLRSWLAHAWLCFAFTYRPRPRRARQHRQMWTRRDPVGSGGLWRVGPAPYANPWIMY